MKIVVNNFDFFIMWMSLIGWVATKDFNLDASNPQPLSENKIDIFYNWSEILGFVRFKKKKKKNYFSKQSSQVIHGPNVSAKNFLAHMPTFYLLVCSF